MKNNTIKIKQLTLVAIQIVLLFSLMILLLPGCTDTLQGEKFANQKPVVQFANIPPEGQQFSRNPEIYWYGSDNDGLIDYYRYHIAGEGTVDAAGGPTSYIATVSDADWVQIDVNQTESDPHTTNVIPLVADTNNPVAAAVGQYVFLQGFDMEGLGSDIVYRIFNRNDNPPETRILTINADTPYVNSVFEGGIITGVRLKWEGRDRKDYEDIGLTPPPFDFEWRLFGPFSKDTIKLIKSLPTDTSDGYIKEVFITEDAQVLGVNDPFITCRTSEVDTVINGDSTTIPIEVCDTTIFDSAFFDTASNSPFYTRDTILLVDSSIIANKLVTSSSNGVDPWVQNEADTIYNVYRNGAPDTTIELYFLFWVRSRDDALVKDLTPEFVSFPVINPKYERDIAVIDFTPIWSYNFTQYKNVDTAKAFWYNLIHNWAQSSQYGDVIFDTAFFTAAEEPSPTIHGLTGIDYIIPKRYGLGNIPVKILLKHKMLILYSDSYEKSEFATSNNVSYPEILSAMDAGINVWATWRNPLNVNRNDPSPQIVNAPQLYTNYFGVNLMTYSSWFANVFTFPDPPFPNAGPRIEDFVGAYSLDTNIWPNLTIDTALLHSRCYWPESGTFEPFTHWIDSIGAIPEVNWAARSFGTEVMYLYKSLYGRDNPFGQEYEGSPVAHRFESNLFRSVHMNFTLLAIQQDQAQQLADNVFNWLYDPNISGVSVREDRYPNALYKVSLDQARQQFGERIEERRQQLEQNGGN